MSMPAECCILCPQMPKMRADDQANAAEERAEQQADLDNLMMEKEEALQARATEVEAAARALLAGP